MSLVAAWLWGVLLVGATILFAIAGTLLARRRFAVEILERHNEVAGFIYAVIGVVYAVLLGFTALIVWEQYEKAHTHVEQEANELADLFRDARAFPDGIRQELEKQIRAYARLVVEKEWQAMAEGGSSRETWEAYNQLSQTYQGFRPQNDYENAWYEQSLARLNQLGDHRQLRLLSSQLGLPGAMWVVLLGAGVVTISFSFLFGTRHAAAHVVMTSGLAITIGLVLFSILTLDHPFAGITRLEPDAFRQVAGIFDLGGQSGPVGPAK
jgi:hypothetical protein